MLSYRVPYKQEQDPATASMSHPVDSNTEEKGPTVLIVMLLYKWIDRFCAMHYGFVSVRCF